MPTYTVSQGMQENILGEVIFTVPRRFTYYWINGSTTTTYSFSRVIRLQAMRTGCTVLHREGTEDLVVVTPTYAYVIEAITPIPPLPPLN